MSLAETYSVVPEHGTHKCQFGVHILCMPVTRKHDLQAHVNLVSLQKRKPHQWKMYVFRRPWDGLWLLL